MATVIVAIGTNTVRVDDADVIGSKWTDLGGGKAAAEDNFFYQGALCVSEKVSKGTGGVSFDDSLGVANTEDVETNPATYVFKIYCYTVGLLANKGAGGVNLEIGSGGRRSAFYQWYVEGVDTWPPTSSWLIQAIDPNLAAYRDEITGSPDLTLVDYCGLEAATSGPAVKAENVGFDSIEHVRNGEANLLLTRGDSTDADGVFQDFVDFDEGTVGNRFGFVISQEGTLFVVVILGIAESGTATAFTDSNFSLIWPDGLFDTGFVGLLFDLGNVGTVVTLTDGTFTGRGRTINIQWFDTALDVDGTNDELDIIGHGYETGDYVQYSDEGGTVISDLVDLDRYWVRAVSVDIISLHTTRAGALGDTAQRVLTAAGAPGENHKLTKEIDTRPTLTFTGTSGSAGLTGITFNGIDDLVLTSVVTLLSCKMLNSSNVTAASGATITDLILSLALLDEGVAALTIDDLGDLSICDFTFNDEGHAIEVTAAAGSPFGWDHVTAGYWAPAVNGWEFSTAQAFTSEQVNMDGNHGFVTGDAVFYSDDGGVETIGLTDQNKYYVNVVDADTVTVHLTKSAAVAGSSAINLTTSGSEIHSLYSSKATLFNDAGAAIVVDVTGGTAPSIRNGAGASTTVNVSESMTVTCKNTAGLAVEGIRVRIEEDPSGVLIANGETNASGIYSATFSGSTPQAAVIKARLKGFKNNKAFGTIASGTGLTVPFTMIRDPAVNLP